MIKLTIPVGVKKEEEDGEKEGEEGLEDERAEGSAEEGEDEREVGNNVVVVTMLGKTLPSVGDGGGGEEEGRDEGELVVADDAVGRLVGACVGTRAEKKRERAMLF